MKSLWTGALSTLALYPGSLCGQALVLTQDAALTNRRPEHPSPVKVNNAHIRFVDDPIHPHFRVEAYYCAAHNTPAERRLMEASIAFWNQQSGKFAYKIEREGESQVLPVYFHLKEAPGVYSQEGFFIPAGQIYHGHLTYVEVISDEKIQQLNRHNPDEVTVGFTTHQAIFVSDRYADEVTIGMHEMGHSLGASHCQHGIMDPEMLFVKPRVKKRTIRNILKEAGIPVKGGKVQHSPSERNDRRVLFGKGKVVKNKEKIGPQYLVYRN